MLCTVLKVACVQWNKSAFDKMCGCRVSVAVGISIHLLVERRGVQMLQFDLLVVMAALCVAYLYWELHVCSGTKVHSTSCVDVVCQLLSSAFQFICLLREEGYRCCSRATGQLTFDLLVVMAALCVAYCIGSCVCAVEHKCI